MNNKYSVNVLKIYEGSDIGIYFCVIKYINKQFTTIIGVKIVLPIIKYYNIYLVFRIVRISM